MVEIVGTARQASKAALVFRFVVEDVGVMGGGIQVRSMIQLYNTVSENVRSGGILRTEETRSMGILTGRGMRTDAARGSD
jgi:hypothetical protein